MKYWESLNSEYILKVEPLGFSHNLNGEYDRKQGVKDVRKVYRSENLREKNGKFGFKHVMFVIPNRQPACF